MKRILPILILLLSITNLSFGQYYTNYEDANKGGYDPGDVTLSGISWNFSGTMIGNQNTDNRFESHAARIRGLGTMTMNTDYANGLDNIYIYHALFNTETGPYKWKIEYSTDAGSNWTQIGTEQTTSSTTLTKAGFYNLGISGSVRLKITKTSGSSNSNRLNFDHLMFWGPGESPLPLNFIKIEAFNRASANYLTWQTADEKNVDHFEIQRSVDAREFRSIGRLDASELRERVNTYSYTDLRPEAGMNYYRIIGVDHDGTTTTSRLATARVGRTGLGVHVTVQGLISSQDLSGDALLSVYDVQGRMVFTHAMNGVATVQLPEDIQNGIYLMVLSSGQDVATEKMILQR
jgi:hypothetical protein